LKQLYYGILPKGKGGDMRMAVEGTWIVVKADGPGYYVLVSRGKGKEVPMNQKCYPTYEAACRAARRNKKRIIKAG